MEERDTSEVLPEIDKRAESKITTGSAKSGNKQRIDSTPSLPPAKRNGSLVTSHDARHNQSRDSEKTKKSSSDAVTQSIPNISRKSSADESPATRQSPSSPSKNKRETDKPPPSPPKEKLSTVDQNKAKTNKSNPSRNDKSVTARSQSNKENRKPTIDPTPSLVKEDVKRNNDKFVAKYTRTRPEKKTENKVDTTATKNRVDISPQSRTTEDTMPESSSTMESNYRWHAPARKYDTPRKAPPVKPKSVTIHSDTESSRTSQNSKPAFKLKFHKKPMYSRDKKAKEKDIVVTPRTNKSTSAIESRPKSYHLERDKSIYRTNTYLWEDEKDQITHQPSVNSQTDVMLAYTGEPNSREALKSASGRKRKPKEFTKAFTVFAVRPKKPPWHEDGYVLNRREAKIYQGIKNVYDKPTAKKSRQREFLKKLQEFQVAFGKHEMQEMQRKEQKRQEDRERQTNQLKELRQRFEDEAWHRFHTQYVTSRILEHEKMNRFQYGLPEEPGGEPEFAVKLKRKKKNPQVVLDDKQLSKINKKKYAALFEVNTGPLWSKGDEEPKMEGIDTVVLDVKDADGGAKDAPKEEGNIKEKKKFVKDVIKEAKKELLQAPGNGNNTGLTPRSPVPEEPSSDNNDRKLKTPDFYADESESDDDDMSDIFERARKKYNLEVDEDADAVSRASRVR